MKVNVKTKIKYKGQEYSSPDELPPEARSAYEKAMAGGAEGTGAVAQKIVFNGQEYSSAEQMPASERQLYEDAIKLARDSATSAHSQDTGAGWLTKRQWQVVLLLAGLLLLLLLVALTVLLNR